VRASDVAHDGRRKPGTAGEIQELLRPVNAAPFERLTDLLQEAEPEHHKRPAADWPRWYAAFVTERQLGASVEDAGVCAVQYTLGRVNTTDVVLPR
jgi:hypothetical protein